MSDFLELPDLALRTLGGAVVWADDEAIAARENLITPGPAVFDPATFGPTGKVYDGWETRRRREPGHDDAVIRLGASGIVRGVVIDTAWFTGNHPPEASVEGLAVDGDPPVADLLAAGGWQTLLARTAVKGDTDNAFAVTSRRRVTHVRLRIFPDGGVRSAAARRARHRRSRGAGERGVVTGCSNFDLLPRVPLLPDTRHRFVLVDPRPATAVRLDIHPDGGLARLRLHGPLTPAGRAELGQRWQAAQ